MAISTADMCDVYISDTNQPHDIQIAESLCAQFGLPLRNLGAQISASGMITTVRCFEDNSLVAQAVGEDGTGKVLVVDAGGGTRCAMLGDRLAQKAVDNNWQAIILFGMVRDAAVLATLPIVIRALGTHPLKSVKKQTGERDVPVTFAGVRFTPRSYLYTDQDGILVSKNLLT